MWTGIKLVRSLSGVLFLLGSLVIVVGTVYRLRARQHWSCSSIPDKGKRLISLSTQPVVEWVSKKAFPRDKTAMLWGRPLTCIYEGWNFNFGNAAVTFDTAHLQSSYFHSPSLYSPKLCRTRSQRWGSRMMPLADPVLLMVRTERCTAEGLNPPCNCPIR